MGSLVVDVERGAGRLFKKLEEQPEIEAAVYQVFNDEVHEDLRGWTGAASATTTYRSRTRSMTPQQLPRQQAKKPRQRDGGTSVLRSLGVAAPG